MQESIEKKSKVPYFVSTTENGKGCFVVVPLDVAQKCADYIYRSWYNTLSICEMEEQPRFITSCWCSYEPVGLLFLFPANDDVRLQCDIECIAMAAVASFFSYEVNL